MGTVSVPVWALCDTIVVATPAVYHHFVEWSDGVTDNPRNFNLTQDTTFEAIFAHNPVITYVFNPIMGFVIGDSITPTGMAEADISFSANTNYGYHFVQWNDGVTTATHSIHLTKDTTIEATFAPNEYAVNVTCNSVRGSISGDTGAYEYLSHITFEAIPNYGYHFLRWSDRDTQNPRSVTVTQDITLEAYFAFNIYSIMDGSDSLRGHINGTGSFSYLTQQEITAIPHYGYHFVRWSDGVKTNPRTIELTQDTTMIAIFNRNPVITYNYDANLGYVDGPETTPAGMKADFITFTAYPFKHCHFVKWLDGETDNPRTIYLDQDTTMVAFFARNPVITYNYDASMGYVSGEETTPTGVAEDYITFTAIPNDGYQFVRWSDGSTDNPRTIYLDKDTAMTAIFDYIRSGSCGDNLALRWEYDALAQALTISGNGTLNSNYTFGLEAPIAAEKLVIAEGVTTIGSSAFAGYSILKHLSVAASVKTIYEQAFYNCTGLENIYCYRATPPTAYSNSFDGIEKFECVLHVLSASVDMYKAATGWRDFYYIETIDAEKVTEPVEDVSVIPTATTAEIVWPAVNNAITYEITITKNGEKICTLIFNAQGQLIGIAFAPSRGDAPQKEQTAGFSFTVTGLEAGTSYDLTITAKNESGQELDKKNVSFHTDSAEGIEDIHVDSDKPVKVLMDGQIYILRGEHIYDAAGKMIK